MFPGQYDVCWARRCAAVAPAQEHVPEFTYQISKSSDIWSQLRFPQKLPSVLALGSVILVVSFVVVFISQWLPGRSATQASGKVMAFQEQRGRGGAQLPAEGSD